MFPPRIAQFTYLLTVALFVLGFYFSDVRLWGFSVWAHHPPVVIWAVVTAALLWLIFSKRLFDSPVAAKPADRPRGFWLLAGVATVLLGALFVLFRAKTHFLGDGYTLLASLADDYPLLKERQLGEALLHLWVKRLTGLDGQTGALLSFQIVSVTCGVLFVLATFWFASRQFSLIRDRIFFFLGMASSGCMLLFFGYVEHYSAFALTVALYLYVGVLAAQRRVSRWLILPCFIAASIMHVFGVTLIPSALYILLAGTRLGYRLKNLSRSIKMAMWALLFSVGTVAAVYLYSAYYFFRFALLPLIPGPFTVEGYHLFSPAHLLDYVNLIVLLLPGSLIILALAPALPLKKLLRLRPYTFLLVTTVSSLLTAFIFDPKLGMPRDWDLFAFAGIPLAALAYLVLLDKHSVRIVSPSLVSLSVVLGLLALAGRVSTVNVDRIAIAQFKDQIQLDKVKNMNSRATLIDYYRKHDQPTEAESEYASWMADFPERLDFDTARQAITVREYSRAIGLLEKIVKKNPLYWDAWTYLGASYGAQGGYRKARECFNISLGLNPFGKRAYNELGRLYTQNKDLNAAEDALLDALKLDPEYAQALYNLAVVYKKKGQSERYVSYLKRAASSSEAPMASLRELGDYCASVGEFDKATAHYRQAVKKGLDTLYVEEVRKRYPALRK